MLRRKKQQIVLNVFSCNDSKNLKGKNVRWIESETAAATGILRC